MATCRFCDDRHLVKMYSESLKKDRPDITVKVKVQLHELHVDEKRYISVPLSHGMYPLNFCPMCERSLV